MSLFTLGIIFICGIILFYFLFGSSGAFYFGLFFWCFGCYIADCLIKYFRKLEQNKVDERLLQNRPPELNLSEFSWWKKNIEPKYRYLNTYPPDWGIRRKYVAEIYKHNCGNCGNSVEFNCGHVHHIKLLKNKGTNSIENLVFLCRHCHEDQHEHLKYYKERRLKIIKERGITEADYFKEQAEMQAILRPMIKKENASIKELKKMLKIED